MAPRRPARTERRARARAQEKLGEAQEKLAALSPGGSRERPVRVTSSAVIEVRARATPCPRCGGELALEDHTAPQPGLRQVAMRCRLCHVPRSLWFRLEAVEPS